MLPVAAPAAVPANVPTDDWKDWWFTIPRAIEISKGEGVDALVPWLGAGARAPLASLKPVMLDESTCDRVASVLNQLKNKKCIHVYI